jgi:CheY-like chemotaxis protein
MTAVQTGPPIPPGVVLQTAAPSHGDSPEGGARRGLPTSTQRGHGKRVLVVDDNVDFALSFAELIRHLGCEVAVAHDGPTALATARDWKPAVALLDIGLPGMDGFELARRLRQTAKHPLKLIAVTAYDQEQDRARSLAAGFDIHVAKPVDLKAFPALLDLALS